MTIDIILSTVALCLCYASFGEWMLHKHIMHAPLWGFRYPYRAHAEVHHGIFGADKSYHVQKKDDAEKIPMAWWNGIAIILIGALPFHVAGIVMYSYSSTSAACAFWLTAIATFFAYYGTYERLHWIMHAPKNRWIETTFIFRWLNAHHLLHHQDLRGRNFNVVFPLMDFVRGTRIGRAKSAFEQPRGPSVPNVQPLEQRQQFPDRQ